MDHLTTQAPEQSSVTPASEFAAFSREDYRQQVIRLQARLDRIKAEMDEVRNELEEDFDITDNGGPNKAMRLANMIDEAIYGPGGF